MTDIGSDGHSKLHDFLPETPFPRRMRAGGHFTFSKLLEIGEQAERHSTVEDVQAKIGASGQLIFVSLRHEISGNRGARITEVENIVYREARKAEKKPIADRPLDLAAQWTRSVTPDSILLFNYSAGHTELPPNSLRPHLQHAGRRLSWPGRPWAAYCHTAIATTG